MSDWNANINREYYLFHGFDFLDLSFVFGNQFLDVRLQSFDSDLFNFVCFLFDPLLAANLFGRFSYILLFFQLDGVTKTVTKKSNIKGKPLD